ncbi:MAG TPA: hypothetical protein VMB84_12775 [Stellaceae bacterium]|nr:hypothetical protein [Stellaceae bacterium]
MIERRRLLLLAPLALAAGCAPAAAPQDPAQPLADVPGGDAPLDKPAHVAAPVALVASAPTRRLLRAGAVGVGGELGDLGGNAQGARALLRSTAPSDGDIQYFLAAMIRVLTERYPNLERVDDLAAARAGGFRTTLVLDLRAFRPSAAADANRADATLVVLDAAQKPLTRIAAQGMSGGVGGRLSDAIDAAAAELAQKTAKLLN